MPQKSLCLALVTIAFCTMVAMAIADPLVAHAAAPAYTADGKLVAPADYREWIYLSSGCA